jgi:hypothetical protein
LLLPLAPIQREAIGKQISLALMHMRKLESFAGNWASVPGNGGRSVINYFAARPNFIDL